MKSSLLLLNGLEKPVIDWIKIVQSNGGATPSGNTNRALSNFYAKLRSSGLNNKIKSLNAFVPDNLIAAQTPLISTVGSSIWSNTNFVTGDLTINGLKGNGSNKYLNTGITCNSIFSTSNMGVTLYVPENSAGVGHNYGCANDPGYTNDCVGTFWVSGAGVFMDSYNTVVTTGGRYTITQVANWTGLLSMQRTANNVFNAYWQKPGAAVVLAQGPYANSGGSVPTTTMYAFCSNSSTAPSFYSGDRMSILAFHDGMTAAETIQFGALIKSLRQQLGGGYV